MILVNIALSILVILAGLLLLAKSKKDELGTVFKIASYTSICVGLIMIGVSITMCMFNCCDKGNNRCSKAQQCCQYDGKSGASSSYDMSKCSKRQRCCKKKNRKCSKGAAQVSSDSTSTGSN